MSRWTALLIVAVAAGCAKKSVPASSPEGYYRMDEESDYGGMPPPPPPPPDAMDDMPSPAAAPVEATESRRPAGKPSRSAPVQPEGAVTSEAAPQPAPDEPTPGEPGQAEAAKAERMVHYTGWARLRVTKLQETLDKLAELAASRGGRVERLSSDSITVRVPVATFDASWKEAIGLGDVIEKSVGAEDVTDAFMAIDLRVKTLRITRDRLVALLAKAQTEEEKLTLLRELKRVTEQLDGFESQLRMLRGLADFSTITIELVPREAVGAGETEPDVAGFEWIRGLSPFHRGIGLDTKRVELPVPTGMVALTPRGRFVAESPEGVILTTGRLLNDPQADAHFWIEAVADRLTTEFASAELLAVGEWECLRLVDGSDKPYSWEVCVRGEASDKQLDLAHIYYPDTGSYERYRGAIAGSLGDAVAALGLDPDQYIGTYCTNTNTYLVDEVTEVPVEPAGEKE